MQGFLCVVYPAYQILFKTANHTNYELPVLLLLSVFKVVMKAAFVSAAAHKEDIVPEEVVLTVDFFRCVLSGHFHAQPVLDIARSGSGRSVFANRARIA